MLDVDSSLKDLLINLFVEACGYAPSSICPLPAHASKRRMFRLQHTESSMTSIAVVNDNVAENDAFVAFAKAFCNAKLPAPKVSAYDRSAGVYLVEDLGNETLYDKICAHSAECRYSDSLFNDYQKIVKLLPSFQAKAATVIDIKDCFEGAYFNAQAALQDIEAFHNHFIKLAIPATDWQPIGIELTEFAKSACHPDEFEFMHRDFQSRNIMLKNGEPIFIDFQSGRLGPPQYDLASLLFQAQAQIPNTVRKQLLNDYLDARDDFGPINRDQFIGRFYEIAVLRQIQVLSVYGKLGLVESNKYFLESIPLALNNLQYIFKTHEFNGQLNHFQQLVATLHHQFCNQD